MTIHARACNATSRTLAVIGLAVGLVAGGSALADDKKVVNVYNWTDYIDETALKDFEKETGIKVNYDVYDSNEVLESKLMAGASGYDVVVPSGSFFQRQVQAGIYQKLDKSKMPNLKHLDATLQKREAVYDPGNEHGVIYMWGTTGIGYNVDKVKAALGDDAPIGSWDLIFDPKYASKLKDCGIYLLDAPEEVFEAALDYMGMDPHSTSRQDYEKMLAMLQKIRPYVTKFSSSEYLSALASGDACVAHGWSGDVLQAKKRAEQAGNGVKVDYYIPKEGALMWFDIMAVPKSAPHPENAFAFINFIQQPKVMARISDKTQYANANKASWQYITPAIRDNKAVFPPESVKEKLFVDTAVDHNTQRMRTRFWNRFKAGE